MTATEPFDRFLWSIALLLSGPDLNSELISSILNISPTQSYKLGEAYELPEGRIIRRRNGVWVIKQVSESCKSNYLNVALEAFGDEIKPLLLRLKESRLSLEELPGVGRAHVDIVILASISVGDPTKRTFCISACNAKWLADLGLPIDFTVDNIVEPEHEGLR